VGRGISHGDGSWNALPANFPGEKKLSYWIRKVRDITHYERVIVSIWVIRSTII
jgi:hypothetical protein